MIVRLGVVVVLCLVALLTPINAEVTVRNGSYHDLVISFSHNVDAENGKSIVESLKNLLGEASNVLHAAIGLRIGGVTFHLPSTWDTSTWQQMTVHPTSDIPVGAEDLLVDDVVDSAFGKNPFAVQYGGCGVPARRITVSAEFLNSSVDEYPKGKLLAREWLKYRYGVFDENGYDGDDLYPSYYLVPGTVEPKITECTHPDVEYYYKDTDNNTCTLAIPFASSANCEIHPVEDSLNVTSSLMYYHKELPNMDTVCGKEHAHKDSTPSKHNILCSGSSIWDILKMSGDFNETTTDEHSATNQAPEEGIQFSYQQESKPRLVVAFENSANLHSQGRLILFALRKFVHSLPEGSDFGLYSFNDQPSEIRALSPLSNRDVPISADFDKDGNVCTTCAVEKAVEVLGDKPQVRSSIILIVGSDSSGIDQELPKKLADLGACLTIIAFTDEENKAEGYDELISVSSCNSIVKISKELQDDISFRVLYPKLQESFPKMPTNTPISMVKYGIISVDKTLVITMNSNAEKYTLWTEKPLETNRISCTSREKNVTLNPSVRTSTISSYTFEPAEDKVTCKLFYKLTGEVFAQVEMTTKPGEFVNGEVWVHDTSESELEQMPLIIYAKINFGNYPIQDAKVTATVIGPHGIVDKFDLFDNGRGNPDITRHDGIYSRSFVNFTVEGEHKVIVMASDASGESKVGKKGQDLCCGSKVNSNQDEAGYFIETFHTSFLAKKRSAESFKPSKVVDLRVKSFDPSNSVVLKWTAPGGEADRGQASSYEFLAFCKSEECNETGQLPDWIELNDSIATPNIPGEEEVAVFLFKSGLPNNETVSIVLRSMNHKGQYSDTSNLVNVKFGDLSEPPTTTIDPVADKARGISQATIRAIVGGSVLGLFLLLCIAVVVHKTAKKIRGPRSRDIPKSERINLGFSDSTKDLKNIDSRDGSMRRVESFPVVLYTHDQVKDCKKKQVKDPPLYNHVIGPKPWLSMDSLPRKPNKEDDNKSVDSVSTMPANGTNSASNEMKQLDNASHSSEVNLEKIAKF